MTGFTIEPTGRDDEWTHQLVRLSDGVVVGFHETERRAQAFADRGAEPLPVEYTSRPVEHDDQFELFGGGV